ncbi:type IV pilin [Halopelagius longus]|uniref:Flagellin N-terminal-like domain-containing protein n=1 Tax=Halopelagius longus TaxID=1236180 RepID=A0A1H1E588_9EURY|nr:type IV pilin [Halopelagius longus]RDI71591.1 type IV pilin [Halopelagius longus]SDQ83296.1 flagellin N-terminal-like domain-containing protein [Halopelagius longus]
MSDRALSPLVGIVVLVGVTVVLTAVVGAGTVALSADSTPTPTSGHSTARVAFSLSVEGDTVALTHERGPSLSVRRLSVRVEIDGTPLRRQPPVPFFSARGFRSGPTGPFNAAADGTWSAGERASFTVAGTNDPSLADGRTVTVTVYGDGGRLARLSAGVGT